MAESNRPPSRAGGHWSDGETTALIDAWVDLQRRRRARDDDDHLPVDWHAVSIAVNSYRAALGIVRSDRSPAQCKGRVIRLKRRYRKELAMATTGAPSTWTFFPRLRAIFVAAGCSPPRRRPVPVVMEEENPMPAGAEDGKRGAGGNACGSATKDEPGHDAVGGSYGSTATAAVYRCGAAMNACGGAAVDEPGRGTAVDSRALVLHPRPGAATDGGATADARGVVLSGAQPVVPRRPRSGPRVGPDVGHTEAALVTNLMGMYERIVTKRLDVEKARAEAAMFTGTSSKPLAALVTTSWGCLCVTWMKQGGVVTRILYPLYC
ncbi:hypothetical protein ACP70R_040090 [Stipagrostis hirtigluma subsp. patula]